MARALSGGALYLTGRSSRSVGAAAQMLPEDPKANLLWRFAGADCPKAQAAGQGGCHLPDEWKSDRACPGRQARSDLTRVKSNKKGDDFGQGGLRLSGLVRLYKSLELYFPAPLARDRVRQPNGGPEFDGARPVDTMIRGSSRTCSPAPAGR